MEAKVLSRRNNSRQTRMLLALFPDFPHVWCKWKAGRSLKTLLLRNRVMTYLMLKPFCPLWANVCICLVNWQRAASSKTTLYKIQIWWKFVSLSQYDVCQQVLECALWKQMACPMNSRFHIRNWLGFSFSACDKYFLKLETYRMIQTQAVQQRIANGNWAPTSAPEVLFVLFVASCVYAVQLRIAWSSGEENWKHCFSLWYNGLLQRCINAKFTPMT